MKLTWIECGYTQNNVIHTKQVYRRRYTTKQGYTSKSKITKTMSKLQKQNNTTPEQAKQRQSMQSKSKITKQRGLTSPHLDGARHRQNRHSPNFYEKPLPPSKRGRKGHRQRKQTRRKQKGLDQAPMLCSECERVVLAAPRSNPEPFCLCVQIRQWLAPMKYGARGKSEGGNWVQWRASGVKRI